MTTNLLCLSGCLLLLMLLTGCSQQAASLHRLQTETAKVSAAQSSALTIQPLSVHQYRTTQGDIYLGNLNSKIQSLTHLVTRSKNTQNPEHQLLLASSLFHRYRITGVFDDVVHAQKYLSKALNNQRSDAALMLQASIFSTVHEFDKALSILKEITTRLYQPAQILKTEIYLAQGFYDQAKAEIRLIASTDVQVLALQANLEIEKGNLDDSLQLFNQAQHKYKSTNPVTLAWLQVQMGIALLRNQRVQEAQIFFQSAQLRLPAYYLATEHIAESELILGNLAAAEKLYSSVSQQTDNPEFYAMLAKTQQQLGNNDAATNNLQIAEKSYLQLLQAYPQVFAQHAAQFFYDTSNLTKALHLAELNLQNRQDIHSWLLLSQIRKALSQSKRSCDALAKANSANMYPPELKYENKISNCGSNN